MGAGGTHGWVMGAVGAKVGGEGARWDTPAGDGAAKGTHEWVMEE